MRSCRLILTSVLLLAPAPVFAAEGLRELATLKGPTDTVSQAVISPDGKVLAAASGNFRAAKVKLWGLATGKEVATLPGDTGSPDALTFSPDGKRLAAGGLAAVLVWHVATRREIATFKGKGSRNIALAFSPDGKRLAVSEGRRVTLQDVESGRELSSFWCRRGLGGWQVFAFTKDLRTMASANYQEIDVWDVATGKVRAVLPERRGAVCCAAYSDDGKTLIAASLLTDGRGNYRGGARLWDVAAGRERAVFKEGIGRVHALALSPDGRTLALLDRADQYDEPSLKVVDVAMGQQRHIYPEPTYSFLSLTFAAGGKLLVTGTSDKALRVWEVSPGERERK
jgi:WD40 repeat protein